MTRARGERMTESILHPSERWRNQQPLSVTSLDVTRPYPRTPRGNKYLLTFVDHLSKFVEAFPIPDQTAETRARVYATQIVTRDGTGSKLITDQGPAFMSSFFNEMCKILRIRRARTSPYHPASNGQAERWHRYFTMRYHIT